MPRTQTIISFIAAVVFSLLFVFQNCSEVAFQEANVGSKTSKEGDGDGTSGGLDVPEEGDEGQNGGTSNATTPEGDPIEDPVVMPGEDPIEDPVVMPGDDPQEDPVVMPEPEPQPEPEVTCPFGTCGVIEENSGLSGKLYYLDSSHEVFGSRLNDAKIDDYPTGTTVPVSIRLSDVNVPEQDWEAGFKVGNGDYVKTENDELLNEYFSIDVSGKISLPQGDYQFGIISDDGMRVTINDQVILNDDGVHGPRWACATQKVTFAEGESKSIRIQYFQGPRRQIAMQLYSRSYSKKDRSCGDSGGFEIVRSEDFK